MHLSVGHVFIDIVEFLYVWHIALSFRHVHQCLRHRYYAGAKASLTTLKA